MTFLFWCYAIAFICTKIIDVGEMPEANKYRLVPFVLAFLYSLFTWNGVAMAISFAGLVLNGLALLPFVRPWGILRLTSLTYAFTAAFVTIAPAIREKIVDLTFWASYHMEELAIAGAVLVVIGHVLTGNLNFVSILFLAPVAAAVFALLPVFILEIIDEILYASPDALVFCTFGVVFIIASYLNISNGGLGRSAFAFVTMGHDAAHQIIVYRKIGTNEYLFSSTERGDKKEGWAGKQKANYEYVTSKAVSHVGRAQSMIHKQLKGSKVRGTAQRYRLDDERDVDYVLRQL